MTWAATEGLPYPLGASRTADGAYNFALYSKRATAVRLVLLGPAAAAAPPVLEVALDPLRHKSGRVWHCRLPAAAIEGAGARYYAYRVDGVGAFHPDRLLFDPYARALHFAPDHRRGDPVVGRLADATPPVAAARRPAPRVRHEADAIVYELHVDAFTRDPSSEVARELAGTFAGVVAKIPYLVDLGVTIVELMPVYQNDPAGGEYWGYMPMSYFAPNRAYGGIGDPCDAFRAMVDALHAAGLEVVLDVVYNHTAEAGAGPEGTVYSYKGIDNDTYYLMTAEGGYADFSGTGNTTNCANRTVCRMIVDSMRFWVTEMGVDGFRFDLASVFSRRPDGTLDTDEPPIFAAIASDPDFDGIRLIAEPWDAAGAYELGRAFPGATWLQWNGRFRDDLRRAIRGDAGLVGALVARLYGSDDLFPDDPMHAYHAYQSVNFITCHDGFTLHDLVSYDRKHNLANGHDNRDGSDDNLSWNCGHEGEAGAPADVLALRERQARNFIAVLMLANGTPMLRAGDELLHTTGGNNNPYNQAAPNWIDWTRRTTHGGFHRFVRALIAFRKAHPSLARSRFWRDDVRWFGPDGPVDFGEHGRGVAMLVYGGRVGDDDVLALINPAAEARVFALVHGAAPWRRVVDTARPSPDDVVDAAVAPLVTTPGYLVGARTVAILVRPGSVP